MLAEPSETPWRKSEIEKERNRALCFFSCIPSVWQMASVFMSPVSVWAPTNPRLRRTPSTSTSMFVSLASSDSQPPSEDLYPETTGDRSRKDRRRVVRLAWEKLVRWSRSWRSKTKTDVLERTNKVSFFLSFFIFQLRPLRILVPNQFLYIHWSIFLA